MNSIRFPLEFGPHIVIFLAFRLIVVPCLPFDSHTQKTISFTDFDMIKLYTGYKVSMKILRLDYLPSFVTVAQLCLHAKKEKRKKERKKKFTWHIAQFTRFFCCCLASIKSRPLQMYLILLFSFNFFFFFFFVSTFLLCNCVLWSAVYALVHNAKYQFWNLE